MSLKKPVTSALLAVLPRPCLFDIVVLTFLCLARPARIPWPCRGLTLPFIYLARTQRSSTAIEPVKRRIPSDLRN
jgi:hypothetical protein